ncbi:DUF6759 domain-containing protein [Kaistella solincola]|uniref:DUF6759 domain-containing protein n=1 Tax=Kaistella solincola TaxID=510955 RepID=UPI00068D7A27|nr:DUF6759 domain-containing protein [Kaistella solincola]
MKSIFSGFLLLFFLSCEVLPPGSVYRSPAGQAPTNASAPKNEGSEFDQLMAKDQIDKRKVTAEVLTYLLNDPDPTEKQTGAVIENKSNCNIIIRLVGINSTKIYNLPIPRQSKNQFVIDKGNYTLKSDICGANYYSQKDITEPLILKLSNN